MKLITELFGYSNKNPYLCIVIEKNRYSFTYPIGMVPFWIHTHTTCTYLSMSNLNNRCKSTKVSYIQSPDMNDNGDFKQEVIIDLTKEQLDAYNLHVREFEKEKLNGLDTHSILKEGENALDSNGLLQVLFYFHVDTDEGFKIYKSTIVQVNLV